MTEKLDSEWVEQEAEEIRAAMKNLVSIFWQYLYMERGRAARARETFGWKHGCRFRDGKTGGNIAWFEYRGGTKYPVQELTFRQVAANAKGLEREWIMEIEEEAKKIRDLKKKLGEINSRIHGYRQSVENHKATTKIQQLQDKADNSPRARS